jgi:hypothetical protein
MKYVSYALALTFMAVSSASAAVVNYSNVTVSCKETVHALTTETLSISFDNSGVGKISGGAIGTNSCAFQLTNQIVFPPVANGTYTFSAVPGNQNNVCWAVGFCNGSAVTDTLVVSNVPGGQQFTVTSGSITTSFVLPTPEPNELALVGLGLIGFVSVFKKRKS